MAKTETTVRGYVYTVTSPNGGTVTDAEGKLNKTVDAGDQVTVTAPSDSLTCDDDDAVICKANFKSPLLALRLLGQGENALPAGYTRLEFLESTGTQYIDTAVKLSNESEVTMEFAIVARRAANNVIYGEETNTSARFSFFVEVAPNFYPRWDFARQTKSGTSVLDTQVKYKSKHNASGVSLNGRQVVSYASVEAFETGGSLGVFGLKSLYMTLARIYSFAISRAGKMQVDYVPCIAPNGKPGMFNKVDGTVKGNADTGQFIAGVGTVAQLTNLLRNLPATGGALTLSLPAEANTPEVAEALQACHDTKGWTLTVHEYRPAATATYSLRRVRSVVWCRPSPCKQGSYVDNFGTRWQIERCAAIFGALGQDPVAYGYTPFDSVEQAAESWELQPYVDPNAEELTNGI